ncbi:MAG: hypothetical protein IJW02_03230 [Clostridia bacterium]|nr:hypothetical protein [Clostridia bacterium]
MSKTFKFLVWSGKKAVVFLALTVALSLAVVGTTIAYIIDYTESLKNTFTPPKVDISTVNGNVITNNSDVDVYIRAAVVVTWVNNNGTADTSDDTTLSTSPVEGEGEDYTLSVNTGWVKGTDGFYYYTSKVDPSTASVTLLSEVNADTITNGDYTLTVQVISSAIQATPAEAVIGAWTSVSGVDTSDNDKLIITTTP